MSALIQIAWFIAEAIGELLVQSAVQPFVDWMYKILRSRSHSERSSETDSNEAASSSFTPSAGSPEFDLTSFPAPSVSHEYDFRYFLHGGSSIRRFWFGLRRRNRNS